MFASYIKYTKTVLVTALLLGFSISSVYAQEAKVANDTKAAKIEQSKVVKASKDKKAKATKKKKQKQDVTATTTVTPPVAPVSPPPPPPPPKPLELTISFAGDCTLGEFLGMGYDSTFTEYYDKYGPTWAFANVKDIFSKDDVTYVNLEGPLTNFPQTAVKQFPIKGDVRNVNCLTNGSIEVCNLANNHTWDCGQQGLDETERVLQAAGIAYCGGNNPVTYLERKGIKIAFLGLDGWDCGEYTLSINENAIKTAKANGAQLVIVQFHWGTEREYVHEYDQTILAHHAIDHGADIVVGAHPHVLQDTEIYNGKLIAYSMGNFSFGANINPADKDSVIIQQTFVKTSTGFQYGPTKYIPCRISSVSYTNDYKPTPYTEQADIDRVLTKLKLM